MLTSHDYEDLGAARERFCGKDANIIQFMDYTNGQPDNSRYIPNLVPGMLQPLEELSDNETDQFLSIIDIEVLVKQVEKTTGGLPSAKEQTPPEKQLKHFADAVSKEKMCDIGSKSFSAATKKKAMWAAKIFYQWKCIRNYKLKADRNPMYAEIKTSLVNMQLEEMCEVLCLLVMDIRKQNGDEYPWIAIEQLWSSKV